MIPTGLRIGIFQYDLPLQSYSRDLAVKLREMGAQVDFYGYRLGTHNLVSKQEWADVEIGFYEYEQPAQLGRDERAVLASVCEKVRWRWERYRATKVFGSNLNFMDRSALLQSFAALQRHHYDLFIGIEKQGLIWAGMMGESFGVPHLYYSLELYLEDHAMMKFLRHLRAPEREFHGKALATIVQDPYRAKALREANGVDIPEILIPVAVRGPANRHRTDFLRKRLALDDDAVILLFFGGMSESRMCEQIIEAIDYLPERFVIVFHGYAEDQSYLGRLVTLVQGRGRKVFFSPADLREDELDALIASADIGFAMYRNDNSDDRFTAFSSQKIALFCRNGIPFISNRNESYEQLFRRFRCGEMATTPEEIAGAALRIRDDPGKYREECFKAFSEVYDFDHQFSSLQAYIESRPWSAAVARNT